ncbi:MAG: serine kinase, partial [Ignavibacteria bacterium]|nr:serine kinase [Ignavibacteria bacterium]
MNLRELIQALELSPRCDEKFLDREVLGGYCGDLLSDVMANCKAGFVWITMQVHLNIVAVATLKEISAII